MSALTVTDTLSAPEALAVVRDILAQTDGDAVLLALTERVVFPLTVAYAGHWRRHSILGLIGSIKQQRGVFAWSVHLSGFAAGKEPLTAANGEAPTLEAADAALCQALTALGWHCVGAP